MSTTFFRGENPLKADKLNSAFAERVSRAGDTMQGMLRLAADPVAAFDAATKQYVDRFTAMGVPTGAYIGAAPPGNVLGPLWWDSNSGQLFIQYNDGSSTQWVSASSIDLTSLTYTATGGTTPRTAPDRAADIANVLDYDAGIGGDDAAAIRAAIASGKKYILVPPGTYTMKSVVPTYGSATGPCCFELNNKQDTFIYAYGATFVVDNSVSSPPAGAPATLSICNNSRNVGIFGGTFVGNPTGLTPTQENVGIIFNGVTGMTVRDVKFTGTFLTSITGVYGFDSVFDNCQGFNNANAIDVAHLENVVFNRCRFTADTTRSVTGLSLHYDAPTLGDNRVTTETGATRSLRWGLSNNVRVFDCLFHGFHNGIAIDCIRGALISRTIVRDGLVASSTFAQAGILLYRGTDAITAGLQTMDVTIEDCDISGNGVSSGGGIGGGIFITAASGVIFMVSVIGSRIYDNTNAGINSSDANTISGLRVFGCDFLTRSGGGLQTNAIAPALAALLTAGGTTVGLARDNIGVGGGGIDYLMLEGTSQNGVADADSKRAVLRLTDNQNAGGVGGAIEFGGRRTASGTGAQASGYFASLKGSLVDGSSNTLGTLDVYIRNANTDVLLTKTASFAATGLALTGRLGINGSTPPAKPTVSGAKGGNAALASLLTALASYGLITDSST